jgi:ethanolamine ammonia-lyase small subunit
MSDEPSQPRPAVADPWRRLRQATGARIGQARAGSAPALSEVLAFQLTHARARDAVHAGLDDAALRRSLGALGDAAITVDSLAPDRARYLLRPDQGRALAPGAAQRLGAAQGPHDAVIVLADGLSATATLAHGPALALALADALGGAGWGLAPLVIARQARVALGDAVAAALQAELVVMLIGERPGLTTPDSLGAYLTFRPQPGVSTDADRNCISNIHAAGLSVAEATARVLWLANAARARGATGVMLKDESAAAVRIGVV